MNYLAILVSAFVGMAVGFFWYGPLFGKVWVKLSGFTKEQMAEAQAKGMGKTYALTVLALLITCYILSLFIVEFSLTTSEALRFAFLGWLAFIVPTMANMVLWDGKPGKLYFLNIAERLVSLLLITLVLSSWK